MNQERVFDVITFIMMNKHELKEEVQEEAVKYILNMYQAPPSFINVYEMQFPRFVTRRLLHKLMHNFNLNPEDIEILASTLLESEDFRRYFCEEYNVTRFN